MTEEQRKRIEDFKKTEKYRAWSASEQATFVGLWEGYIALRAQLGPDGYISRAMLGDAFGTKHRGTPSKFMRLIEELEDDQPPRGRRAQPPRPDSSEPVPPAIETAFDAVRKAVDGARKAILDLRSQEGRELTEQYQRLQREQLASADAREQALAERIADLEVASSAAGEESWDNAAALEELRTALQAATSECDAEKLRADQATTAYELALARLAAAEAQVQAGEVRSGVQAAEIVRLTQERDDLVDTATQAAELGLENAALRERADQAARLETMIALMDARHAQEREAMRATYEAALAEERQRRLGWLGVPVRQGDGERG